MTATNNTPPVGAGGSDTGREEITERLPVDDQALTRPFVKREARLARDVPAHQRVPSDELGFDRPLFDHPTPPWPADVPPAETLFERADQPSLTLDLDDDLVIEEPTPPPLWPALPVEATQQPGVPPADNAALTRGQRWLWAAVAGAAVLAAVALGVLAGVLLRRLTLPATPAAAPSRQPVVSAPVPALVPRSTPNTTPPRPTPTTATLLQRARRAARLGEHQRAFDLYRAVLAREPGNKTAMLGRARSGVELGRPDALPARPADAPPELGRQLPLLRVRLALIRGEWRRADRLIKRLPRPVRYRPRQMVWMALAWRGLGRVEEARYALQLVLRDPRLHDNRLKVEAMLDLSEVQLQRGQPHAAFEAARSAAVLARGLGSTALLARAEQQLARSKIALER